MQIVAIISAYNEERFIAGCIENLISQGAQVYLIDNGSTDQTVAIAERYRNQGLMDIELLPRDGMVRLRRILERKEQLASTLDADWFIHVDADEILLPPRSSPTLRAALARIDAQGYSAVNFWEYTFVPTQEAPDHDHADYQKSMRWYYSHLPFFPHRLIAWKRQAERVDLASSGGHLVRFPGLRMYPESFPMRHYLFLSVAHAIRKYGNRIYDPEAVNRGWHGWRANFRPETITLPKQDQLCTWTCDQDLDPPNLRTREWLDPASQVEQVPLTMAIRDPDLEQHSYKRVLDP